MIDEGLNAASKEMQMSVEGVFEGIKTGEFKNTKGTKVITADFEENIRKHLKSINRDLTEEQDKLLKKLLTGQAKNTLDRYLQVSEENQAAFQYMGNLRNEAIANGHVENSGHSLYKDIGGGKSMYIASGVRMAHGHGYGDFNKMDVRRRLQAHPHVGFNLNGSTQVGTSCRTDAFETMTKNADVRSMSAVTSRLVNVATGIGAVESNTDYLGSGSFDPMSSVQTQEAHEEHYDYEFAKFKHKTKFDGASESKKKKLRRLFAAQSYVKNSLLPQMRTNMPVALMLQAANTTDVSPLEASNGGKMNLTLPHRNEKGEMTETTFRTVDRFLEVADYGGFGDVGGNLPSFTPGTVKPEDLNTLLDDDDGGS